MLPVGVPEERLKNLSCLTPSFCFLLYFVLSALNSPPPLHSSSSSSSFPSCSFVCHRAPPNLALPHPLCPTHFPPSTVSHHQPFLPPLSRSQRVRRGDAPVPERRDVLPEPEMRVPSRVQRGAVPTLELRGGERVQRRLVSAPPRGCPAALRPAGPRAAHVNSPLSHELIHTHPPPLSTPNTSCPPRTLEPFLQAKELACVHTGVSTQGRARHGGPVAHARQKRKASTRTHSLEHGLAPSLL